jgi:hypothetical protein
MTFSLTLFGFDHGMVAISSTAHAGFQPLFAALLLASKLFRFNIVRNSSTIIFVINFIL